MRLIHTSTLELHDFTLRMIPPYAILSHTWAEDEVTFQDMTSLAPRRLLKHGYSKIVETCRLAMTHDLNYAWVDTCCIDKTSSAELTEAINSMFGYYARSTICFAHLSDLPSASVNIEPCRWFTRGWTLQELIAPYVLEFYNSTWEHIGSREDLIEVVTQATRIPAVALSGPSDRHHFSLAEKMSWASSRQTTRLEDKAYCLLGLFDVNMPLIYGEGEKAFRRLQEEILKRSSDMTLFAWRPDPKKSSVDEGLPGMGLLAQSPFDFRESAGIEPLHIHFPEFSVTNKGLLIVATDTPLRTMSTRDGRPRGLLGIYLGRKQNGDPSSVLAIFLPLRKVGPGLFYRHSHVPMAEVDMERASAMLRCLHSDLSYHVVMQDIGRLNFQAFRNYAIHVPIQDDYVLDHAIPERLWDPEDRLFLRPKPGLGGFFPSVLAMLFSRSHPWMKEEVLIVCENVSGIPRIGKVDPGSCVLAKRFLFDEKNHEASVRWIDLDGVGITINWRPAQGLSVEKFGHRIVLKSELSMGTGKWYATVSLRANGAEEQKHSREPHTAVMTDIPR